MLQTQLELVLFILFCSISALMGYQHWIQPLMKGGEREISAASERAVAVFIYYIIYFGAQYLFFF